MLSLAREQLAHGTRGAAPAPEVTTGATLDLVLPNGTDLGQVPLDGARRLTLVLSGLLEHATYHAHGDVETSLDRHSDLLRLSVTTRGCSPACLTSSVQVHDLGRSEIGPGDVRWRVRAVPGGARVDWMLVVSAGPGVGSQDAARAASRAAPPMADMRPSATGWSRLPSRLLTNANDSPVSGSAHAPDPPKP